MKSAAFAGGLAMVCLATVSLGAVGLGAGPAMAGPHCDVPLAQWQPRAALQKKLEAEGWTVLSIRSDDGCYKVRATNAQGRRLKAKYDPASLEPVARADDAPDDD
ncbi:MULTISPECIES: PepSY domain-containing protein [Xanthobacter]|uniref:PepSY domain-containing protein n=1 Tax=Xanthobacter TaxID=279 RepID=UPI00351D145F